jgi:S1-C subfamily serine protease
MRVVALRLVGLREQVRCLPDHPAERAGLTPLELEVLRKVNSRPVSTVQEVALAIGRLGVTSIVTRTACRDGRRYGGE